MRGWISMWCLAAAAWLLDGWSAAGTYDVYGCRLPTGQPIGAAGGVHTREASGRQRATDVRPAEGSLGNSTQRSACVTTTWPAGSSTLHPTPRSRTTPSTDPVRRPVAVRMASVATSGSITMLPTGRERRLLTTHRSRAFGIALASFWGIPRFRSRPRTCYERSDLRILRVFLVNQCDGTECAPTGEWSHVTIWAARFGLSDPSAPRFTRDPIGFVTNDGASVEGERPVTFAAEDRGGGIASVGFVVDGQIDARATEPTGSEFLPASVRVFHALPVGA